MLPAVAIRSAIHRMMHRPDSTPLLAQVSVPTLVITGAEDEMIPVEESRRIASGIRGAKLVIIPGAGHLANLEQPEAFNAALNGLMYRGNLHYNVARGAEVQMLAAGQVDAGQVRILQDELASETAEGVGPALVVDDQLFQLGRGGPCVHHG
jgi:predicted dienelactone hydrolase